MLTQPVITGPLPPQSKQAKTPQAGLDLHRYRLLESLDQAQDLESLGATDRPRGSVFLAEHRELAKRVVLRLLPPLEPEARQRLLHDLALGARVHHPNLLAIEDLGRDERGTTYIASEHATGPTLREELARSSLDERAALAVLRQLADVLAAIHKAALIHGHLSPANILLSVPSGAAGDRRWVRLADVGTAALGAPDRSSPYAAPELGSSEDIDPRVDTFALGVIAHQLLTGELPPAPRSADADAAKDEGSGRGAAEATAQGKRGSQPRRLGDLSRVSEHPALTRWPVLAELINSSLAPEPLGRPPAAALLSELERIGAPAAQSPRGGDTLPPAKPRGELGDLEGEIAGCYRLQRLLGHGGLGSVWLAKHVELGSRVAIKVLHCSTEQTHARLLREARAVNLIDSPYILPIADVGQLADGREYATMELLQGETLGARMRRAEGRMRWAEVRPLAIQIAEALLLAHQAGVIHRDLKPENIFLVEGDGDNPAVKLLDFGIAELVEEAPRGTGQVKRFTVHGTPLYVAPEQAIGEPCGPSADIYAFGAVLFELLAGRAPLVGGPPEVLAAKQKREPPSLGTFVPQLEPVIVRMIDRMLAIDPERRPVSLQVLQALRASGEVAIEQALKRAPTVVQGLLEPSEPLVSEPHTGSLPRVRRRRARLSLPLLLAIGAVIGAGSVLALLLLLRPQPAPRPQAPAAAHRSEPAKGPHVQQLPPAPAPPARPAALAPPTAAQAAHVPPKTRPKRPREARRPTRNAASRPAALPRQAPAAAAPPPPASRPAAPAEEWSDPFAADKG